jgi:hypothetical protein
MKQIICTAILGMSVCLFAGCGGDASISKPSSDAGIDAGCGTLDDPNILKLSGLTPAMGESVVNRQIVHGFTVKNAPASNVNFDLRYGANHTAGASTPDRPRFQTTIEGSDVTYLMVIDAWSRAPGHVEFSANGSFTTSKGCTYAFPSPLFSYDITPGPTPDGGVGPEAGPGDTGANADSRVAIDLAAVDSPMVIDGSVGAIDVPDDVPSPVVLDGPSGLDAVLDGELVSVDTASGLD